MSVTPAHEQIPPVDTTGEDTKLWLLRAAKAVVVFVYAFVLVNLVMLILGFFLQLFGASTDAAFTRWVYRGVDRIMDPFRGIFPSYTVSDQSVLDVSLLFAMIVYTIVGITLHAVVTWLTDKIMVLRRRQRIAAERAALSGGPVVGPAVDPASPPRPGVPAGQGPVGR